MPTYVTMIRFTQKGIEAIKDGPARLDAAKQAYRAVGATVKDFYLVTGKYDALVVSDVPDEATAAKLSLAIASKGYSRTETVRAFTEEEYRTIVSQLPKVNVK